MTPHGLSPALPISLLPVASRHLLSAPLEAEVLEGAQSLTCRHLRAQVTWRLNKSCGEAVLSWWCPSECLLRTSPTAHGLSPSVLSRDWGVGGASSAFTHTSNKHTDDSSYAYSAWGFQELSTQILTLLIALEQPCPTGIYSGHSCHLSFSTCHI